MNNGTIELVRADPAMAEEVACFYLRNREALGPFEPAREEEFFTPGYQRQLLAGEQMDWENRRGFRFYIRDVNHPGKIIGSIGLNNVVWGAFRSCFLGYKLGKEHWNRGYMTMAVAMVTDYAFNELHLHRIEANVMPRNAASLRVLEKNGFENEGISKYYLNINGVWEDHIHMVKLNEAMHGRKNNDR